MEVSIVAIGGAAVLLATTRTPFEKILHEVDWPTLLFFIGLFVIVGVAEHAGLITIRAKLAIGITGGNPWLTFVMIIYGCLALQVPLLTTFLLSPPGYIWSIHLSPRQALPQHLAPSFKSTHCGGLWGWGPTWVATEP